MGERAIAIPKAVRFQSVKVDDPGVRGPCRIVFKIVVKKVEMVVRDNGHSLAFADGERVHDDFVGKMMDAVVDHAIQAFEIAGDFVSQKLESAALD